MSFWSSAYYSNILLCIFCILNASPDVISWSHLLCTEEELAPACVASIAVQGCEMINPQPVLAIPREHPLFPANKQSCWEAKGDKPSAPHGSGAESISFLACMMGCCQGGMLRNRRMQQQQPASFLSPLICSKQCSVGSALQMLIPLGLLAVHPQTLAVPGAV